MNNITIIGRLTFDPEMKFVKEDMAVTTFTVAVDRGFKDKDGNKKADFIPVQCWRKLAESVANNLTKGRLVAVQGRLQIDQYTDKDGNKRSKAQIVANEVKYLDWAEDKKQPINDTGFNETSNTEDIPF